MVLIVVNAFRQILRAWSEKVVGTVPRSERVNLRQGTKGLVHDGRTAGAHGEDLAFDGLVGGLDRHLSVEGWLAEALVHYRFWSVFW